MKNSIKITIITFFTVIGFFAFAESSEAATVYVSKSTTNGYQVGSNSNTYAQAQNKNTPWLTVTKAVSSAVSNGDTIVINDGTYNEASFLNPTRSDLTINSETDYGAVIRNAAAGSRVLHVGASATGLTLGKVVIDANNTQIYCIATDTNTLSDFTINGTKLLNPTRSFMRAYDITNLTMSGGWIAESSQAETAFSITAKVAGDHVISDGTITQTGVPAGTHYAFLNTPTVAGNNLSISNITINRTTSAGAVLFGINSTGSSTVSIHDNSFTFSGATSVEAIAVHNHTTITTTSCSVYGNTVDLGGTQSHTIFVGDDAAPTTANMIQNALIYDNNITGGNHGLALGYVTGGKIYNNYANNLSIGVLTKYTTDSEVYNNIINNPGAGSGLYAKGSTNTIFHNNTVIAGASAIWSVMRSTENATGTVYKNNIFYSDRSGGVFVDVEAGSDASFDNNIYYEAQSLAANPWSYQGANYSSFAAWQAIGDTNGKYSDPLFVSSSDFNLQSTSPAIDAGEDLNLSTDYAGNSRYDMPNVTNTGSAGSYSIDYTDIGAYEYITPPDPTLSSSTHSGESTWYNSISPVTMAFSSPYDTGGKAATTDFKYLINQTFSPAIAAVKAGTSLSGAVTFDASNSITSGGTWYVHAIAQNENDTAEYSSNYDTYTVKYDSTGPTVSNLTPSSSSSTESTQPTFAWTGSDASSGINYYQLYIDDTLDTNNIGATSTIPTTKLSCGDHTWYVKAIDNAGNSTNSSTFNLTVSCGENLEISNVEYETDENSITIEWETNNNANETIRYGETKEMKKEELDDDKEKNHKLTLKNLKPNTTYYFRIKSKDSNDSEDRSRIYEVKTKKGETTELRTFSIPGLFKNNPDSGEKETITEKIEEIVEKIQEKIEETSFFNTDVSEKNGKKLLGEVIPNSGQ